MSRNIEVCRDQIGGAQPVAIDPFLTIASAFGPRAAIVIAIAALGATLAGCSSDSAAMTQKPEGKSQMRYFGGPKSPMWPGR